MKNSKIAWTDHTFNPWWGCVKVSQGCKNCYAETFAKRTGNNVWGVDAPRRFFSNKHWQEPLKWNKEAEESGKRRRVFCASMADVFEDRKDLIEPRNRLLDLITATQNLDWLVLTKRPENIDSFMHFSEYENVWIGTTVELQENENRLHHIVHAPFPVRFISIEPMLGPIKLQHDFDGLFTRNWLDKNNGINWVIVGGESGPGCRPFNWDWARDIRDQCAQAGIPFFMKQGGGHPNKRDQMEDFPEDLRIREFPE